MRSRSPKVRSSPVCERYSSRGAADADQGGEMKLNIKIEYDAEREEGETADDESRILGVVGEELES